MAVITDAFEIVKRFALWLAAGYHRARGRIVCHCGVWCPSEAKARSRRWAPVDPRGDAEPYWLCLECRAVRMAAIEARQPRSGRAVW